MANNTPSRNICECVARIIELETCVGISQCFHLTQVNFILISNESFCLSSGATEPTII